MEAEFRRREQEHPGYIREFCARIERINAYFEEQETRFRSWFDTEYALSPAEAHALDQVTLDFRPRQESAYCYRPDYLPPSRSPGLGYHFERFRNLVEDAEEGNYPYDSSEYFHELGNWTAWKAILTGLEAVSPSLHRKLIKVMEPWERRFMEATHPIEEDAPIRDRLAQRTDPHAVKLYARLQEERIPNKLHERFKRDLIEIEYLKP
jgi:hypothetical protein